VDVIGSSLEGDGDGDGDGDWAKTVVPKARHIANRTVDQEQAWARREVILLFPFFI
jgi:hypothetical protein